MDRRSRKVGGCPLGSPPTASSGQRCCCCCAHLPSPVSQAPPALPCFCSCPPPPINLPISASPQGLKPGEFDVDASPHAKREHELLGRRSYLKNFWYAAALSDSVEAGKPHGVGLMGRELVLWRGEDGAVQCIDNTCPHRRAV